jgi:hypothetical protein
LTNKFRTLWDAGYRRLVPVIPPGAAISERSTLFKRVGTSQDGRGKTPGTRGRDGLWSSFDWTSYETDEQDLDRWFKMGASIGIKTGLQPDGTYLVAIDADTLDKNLAVIIRDAVDARFGKPPARVGNHPKALYVLRLDGPMPYSRIEFGTERVEVLSDGRQFVAEGIHPKTGKPYTWPRALVPYSDLPIVQVTA